MKLQYKTWYFLSEFAVEMMLKAFQVGVFEKTDTGSYILEAMQLLNMETMMT